MDPEETLRKARRAAEDCRKGDAKKYLSYYADWRRGGGFAATNGEKRVKAIRKIIRLCGKAKKGYLAACSLRGGRCK